MGLKLTHVILYLNFSFYIESQNVWILCSNLEVTTKLFYLEIITNPEKTHIIFNI